LLRGVDLSRRLFANSAFAAMKAVEILPGPNVQGRDEIKAAIRQTAVTVHHPIGTCKMGQDADAVVDTQLRVHGIDGLRVIDGSVMPLVVRGNTAASIMAIAEKASDLIRGLA
jgi:choline dehydrogenase-like flavoprotein